MKKYKLLLIVFFLVLSIVGIARNNPVWASPKPPAGINSSGVNSPLLTLKNITGNGIYNIGGVCTIEVEFKVPGLKLEADAEVPVLESKKVPFYGDGKLLFPGCHFVHYKQDELKQDKIVSPMSTEDGSAKVCFGASPDLLLTIYYYLDDPASGGRVWIPLPTTLEDNERLVCAPALYTGVYMPAGEKKIVPQTGAGQPGSNPLLPGEGEGGSVLPPPAKVIIPVTGSGTYPVGGICLLTAHYKIKGLSDTVEVEYANDHLTEETLKVPSDAVEGIFYFPGCHVLHYRDGKIKDEMTIQEGDWRICFAAIPDKIMKIYFYQDDLTTIIGPWRGLETTTANGMACADLVYFTGVYTPAGK
jgi:hypothetical protein